MFFRAIVETLKMLFIDTKIITSKTKLIGCGQWHQEEETWRRNTKIRTNSFRSKHWFLCAFAEGAPGDSNSELAPATCRLIYVGHRVFVERGVFGVMHLPFSICRKKKKSTAIVSLLKWLFFQATISLSCFIQYAPSRTCALGRLQVLKGKIIDTVLLLLLNQSYLHLIDSNNLNIYWLLIYIINTHLIKIQISIFFCFPTKWKPHFKKAYKIRTNKDNFSF